MFQIHRNTRLASSRLLRVNSHVVPRSPYRSKSYQEAILNAFASRLKQKSEIGVKSGVGSTQLQAFMEHHQRMLQQQRSRLESMQEEQHQSSGKVQEQPQQRRQTRIQDLPTRQITDQGQIEQVFKQIFGQDTQPRQRQQEIEQPHEKTQEQKINQQRALQEKIARVKTCIDLLKKEVLDQKHIDYYKIVSVIGQTYQRFKQNSMCNAIIHRNFDAFNRQQFFKIPDDKIKQTIDLVVKTVYGA